MSLLFFLHCISCGKLKIRKRILHFTHKHTHNVRTKYFLFSLRCCAVHYLSFPLYKCSRIMKWGKSLSHTNRCRFFQFWIFLVSDDLNLLVTGKSKFHTTGKKIDRKRNNSLNLMASFIVWLDYCNWMQRKKNMFNSFFNMRKYDCEHKTAPAACHPNEQ